MSHSNLCDAFFDGSKKKARSGPLSFYTNENPEEEDIRIIQTYDEVLGVLGVKTGKLYVNTTSFSHTSDRHASFLMEALTRYRGFAKSRGLKETELVRFRWGTCRSSFIKSSCSFKEIEYELLGPRSLSNTLANSCPIFYLRYSNTRSDAEFEAKYIMEHVMPRAIALCMDDDDKKVLGNIKFRLDKYIEMCNDSNKIKDIQKIYRLAEKEMKKEGAFRASACDGVFCCKITQDYDTYWSYNYLMFL